jgi:hypothetical protein
VGTVDADTFRIGCDHIAVRFTGAIAHVSIYSGAKLANAAIVAAAARQYYGI